MGIFIFIFIFFYNWDVVDAPELVLLAALNH